MFAKINHVAIVSENYAQLAQFYEAVFGMQTSAKTRPGRAVTVGDGYVGLNINPRRAGRSAGLDHFGIQVDDCETVFDRMRNRVTLIEEVEAALAARRADDTLAVRLALPELPARRLAQLPVSVRLAHQHLSGSHRAPASPGEPGTARIAEGVAL